MESLLVLFLRLTGLVLLLALPAVFLPHAWMDTIHQALGMGPLPDLPIVSYLTRSVSLLYALLGAVYWYLALDVPRHLPLLRFTNVLLVFFTAVMIGIDVASDLPAWWTVTEGIVLIGWTVMQWWLVRRVARTTCPG
jgi:hypothetical protein